MAVVLPDMARIYIPLLLDKYLVGMEKQGTGWQNLHSTSIR